MGRGEDKNEVVALPLVVQGDFLFQFFSSTTKGHARSGILQLSIDFPIKDIALFLDNARICIR